MRLKSRASVRSQSPNSPGCTDGLRGHAAVSRWSARKRALHARQSTRGAGAPAGGALARAAGGGRGRRAGRGLWVVGAEAGLARAAVDERVGEPGEVAAGLPDAGVL